MIKSTHRKRPQPLPLRPKPVSCTQCAHCCTYVAVDIEPPSRLTWATDILWFLSRPRVRIYMDGDGEWMVEFKARCSHLGPDRRCRIYERRPHICRGFDEPECEINAPGGRTFRTQQEFLAYLEEARPRMYRRLVKDFGPLPRPKRRPRKGR